MSRMLFLNLAVADAARSKRFFTTLGFDVDDRFSDERTTCVVLSENVSVMLLQTERFLDFTDNEICDTSTHTEALIGVECESREEVERIVKTAVSNGGRHALEAQDHEHMYGWSFYDPDGHHWELIWMDEDAFDDED